MNTTFHKTIVDVMLAIVICMLIGGIMSSCVPEPVMARMPYAQSPLMSPLACNTVLDEIEPVTTTDQLRAA